MSTIHNLQLLLLERSNSQHKLLWVFKFQLLDLITMVFASRKKKFNKISTASMGIGPGIVYSVIPIIRAGLDLFERILLLITPWSFMH